MGGARDDAAAPGEPLGAAGPAAAVAAFAWAVLLHTGLGPPPAESQLRWLEPTGFLHRSDALADVLASAPLAFALGLTPALLCTAVTCVASRSAGALCVSLICVVASALFVFYGTSAPYPWEFFGWRGSAALWATAACVGSSLASPALAERWLRLSRGRRLATYLPVALIVVALIRNATGTDPSLRYSISPWPAIPVFGLEVGALFVAAAWAGVALAARGAAATGLVRRAGGVVAGLLLPMAGVGAAAALALLPFRLGAGTLGGLALACAIAVAGITLASRGDAATLRLRARAWAAAAALIATPLLLGEVLARIDYHVTREWRARSLIDALGRFAARETLYPDSLDELVAAGDLERVPAPAIGFRLLANAPFRYQSFGSSFILEFAAPRWVECAYTPPYDDEAAAGGGESLAESWSCPSEPPELW